MGLSLLSLTDEDSKALCGLPASPQADLSPALTALSVFLWAQEGISKARFIWREEVISLLCRSSTHVFCLFWLLSTLLTQLFSCANYSPLKGLKTLLHSNGKTKFSSVRGTGGKQILGARVLHEGSLWSEKNAVHSVSLFLCFQVCIC